jgi:hypothetical protein
MVRVTTRASQSLYERLTRDNGLMTDARGGVHRPVVPQGSAYPAVAFALVSGQIQRGGFDRIANKPSKQHTDCFFEVTAWTPGTDDLPVSDICDRIEALIDGFETEIDGVRLTWLVQEEIQRTPQEQNFFHTQLGWLARCRGTTAPTR